MPARIILSFSLLLVFLWSCNVRENERLRVENDSLRKELNKRHDMVGVMRDVKGLIDSIDASRQVLRTDLNEGMTYENFSNRLRNINEYVKRTGQKIKTAEKELKASDKKLSAYLLMMDALKSELEIRVREVNALEAAVAQYQTENKGLLQTVKLQQTEMAQMQDKIDARQQELTLLEAKVNEMVGAFKVSKAEAYYTRAKAIEEVANKTRLAPRKKKETYKEALELYKKALSLGKAEAKRNISHLERKIR